MARMRTGFVVVGFLTCVAYAVIGCLQILVWNPLAAVPDLELGEIYRVMAERREPMAMNLVLTWGALGVIIAVAALLAGLVRRWNTRQFLVVFLGILVLGAPSHGFAAFNPGMSLADAFGIGGGDYSPFGGLLYAVSGLALLAVIGLGYREALNERRHVAAGSPEGAVT